MRFRLIALPIIFLALIASTGAQTSGDPPQLTATEIINRHLTAVGGREALARIRSRVAIGTVRRENETAARMAIASEAPNRVSAMYLFEQFTVQQTYDGTNPIFRPNLTRAARETSAVQDKFLEAVASGLMFNSISLYNLLVMPPPSGVTFEARGTRRIDGRRAYIVEVNRPRLPDIRLFFDAENFMWVRTEFGRVRMERPQGTFTNDVVSRAEDTTEFNFYFATSDFREVDGVRLPFRFEQSMTYPILRERTNGTITGTITEYRHNITIDPSMFR